VNCRISIHEWPGHCTDGAAQEHDESHKQRAGDLNKRGSGELSKRFVYVYDEI
jgi:hypothetical protein